MSELFYQNLSIESRNLYDDLHAEHLDALYNYPNRLLQDLCQVMGLPKWGAKHLMIGRLWLRVHGVNIDDPEQELERRSPVSEQEELDSYREESEQSADRNFVATDDDELSYRSADSESEEGEGTSSSSDEDIDMTRPSVQGRSRVQMEQWIRRVRRRSNQSYVVPSSDSEDEE